ncbi:lysosomal dipeptide transporter MFSD1-like [Aquarana catesbeiana]|uniref:lysosomal dipeptide transporter MFSD1-like n=1 Tax=Aquarana catesbeiana TaxID=8400 RepID=UPI003CCA3578
MAKISSGHGPAKNGSITGSGRCICRNLRRGYGLCGDEHGNPIPTLEELVPHAQVSQSCSIQLDPRANSKGLETMGTPEPAVIPETSSSTGARSGRPSKTSTLTLVQNRITAFWFKGKELALAFGLTLSFSRLGSVLNFFLTQRFEAHFGIQWTLWGGTILCVLGFCSAVIVSVLDKVGMKQLGLDGTIQEASKKVRVQDIRRLPLRYWLLVLTITFFYNGVFPFVADASKFIQDKYPGYDQQTASYIAGAVYDSSLVLSAIVGILIDYVGMRGIMAVLCAVFTLPVFALLAFTFVPPLVSTLWLGVTYSFAAASMWPSIALMVPQATLGTALGLAGSVQMIGIGTSNLIVGRILGTKSSEAKIPLWRWQQMMIFMLANTIACIVTSVILNVVDNKQGGTLNKMSKRRPQMKHKYRDDANGTPLLNDEDDCNSIN